MAGVGFCDSNKTVYNNRSLEWPETIAGRTAMLACPGATGNATRQCGTDTVWSAPDLTLCELAINIVSNALQQSVCMTPVIRWHDYINTKFIIRVVEL